MVLMFSLLEDSEDSLHPLWVEYFEQTTLLLLSSRSEKYHRTHVKLAFLFFRTFGICFHAHCILLIDFKAIPSKMMCFSKACLKFPEKISVETAEV